MVLPRKFVSSLVLACALTVPVASHAEVFDGNKLMEFADADDRNASGKSAKLDYQKAAYLIGFVIGVHDALAYTAFCPPNEGSVGQIVAVVKKYLRDNPDKWDQPGSTLVVNALSASFPCRKK